MKQLNIFIVTQLNIQKVSLLIMILPAKYFMDSLDSACVYHNASTRFSDGGEFGFGAEVGISTQKLHARGPIGLQEMTSTKYLIYGKGQIR